MPDRIQYTGTGTLLLATIVALVGRAAPAAAAKPAPFPAEAVEFFETKVRPILADSCVKCHGSSKQASGLRLDSRESILEGGENGPSLVPGKPDESLIVQAVRQTHEDVKMPPKGKLPATAVEAIAAWVKMGAPWSQGPIPTADAKARAAQAHWAFQPVRAVNPPAVRNRAWVKSPIDAFVLARLEGQGMSPAPKADKRTLIRRATFDLTGLPPTPQEIAAFETNLDANAFAKVVDRLLASPRYGERWGRHWLDVARYADTKGYVFMEERRYPYSYTYRDYVIQAFNDDVPYNRFITEQIAADRLPRGDDTRSLAALGFLTVGRRFLNNQQDVLDDRIDVVTRGLLGLSVTCARCHDHKFDPIPTDDYYSLYGVFASSVEPADLPTINAPKASPEFLDFERKLKAAQQKVDDYLAATKAEIEDDWRDNVAACFQAAFDLNFEPRNPKLDDRARRDGLNPPRLRGAIARWKSQLAGTKAGSNPVFGPWHAFAAIPAAEFAKRAPDVARSFQDPKKPTNPVVAKSFAAKPPATMAEVAARYAALFAKAETLWQDRDLSKESKALADAGWEGLRQVLYAPGGPAALTDDLAMKVFDKAERNKLRNLAKVVEALKATHPGAPPRAMVVNDAPSPYNPFVFVRGNPGRRGKAVPRQFLAVLSGKDRKPFSDGSGRLELARAIARDDNPLTARVMVNRIWQHHFGQGLVATPSDFGLRSDPPSHPELLDWLADRFVGGGWSIKAMHRLIMLSNTYQQQSDNVYGSSYTERDPQNRLLWKYSRHRLEFEAMRDALLAASGRLDTTVGGRPVAIAEPPFSPRRTVYGYIDRQNLEGVYRVFDFASPDASSPRRFETTVPQQALFLMNGPFVVEQARELARKAEGQARDPKDRVRWLYRRLFGRDPAAREVALGLAFVNAQSAMNTVPTPIWQNGFGGVDESTHRVAGFSPLPHWTGTAWQFGPALPDPKGGYVNLNAQGGHPGNDLQHTAIRRWTAPHDALIAIDGLLTHPARKGQGDGVRGRIVASRGGELGSWVAQAAKVEAGVERYEVKQGETIDFVLDCRTEPSFDSFSWLPVVRQLSPSPFDWSAKDEFQGPMPPPLPAWGQYAQVLLLANEFMFID